MCFLYMLKMCYLSTNLNPFYPSVTFHIETSHFLYVMQHWDEVDLTESVFCGCEFHYIS